MMDWREKETEITELSKSTPRKPAFFEALVLKFKRDGGMKQIVTVAEMTATIEAYKEGMKSANGFVFKTETKEQQAEYSGIPGSILRTAKELITGPRQELYDNPVEAFRRCAAIASVLIGRTVTPQDCVKVLMALKQARMAKKNTPEHMSDLAGYTDILNQVEVAEQIKKENING